MPGNKHKITRWSVSGFIYLCFFTVFFYCFRNLEFASIFPVLVLSFIVSAFAAFLLHYGVFHFALPRVNSIESRYKLILLLASLATGALLIVIIPIRNPALLHDHRLEINEVGIGHLKKVQSSHQLNEVARIHEDGSLEYLFPYFENKKKARVEDEGPGLTTLKKASIFQWREKIWGDVKVIVNLAQGPESGIVKLLWGDHSQHLNLYSPKKGQRIVILEHAAWDRTALYSTITFTVAAIVILSLSIFIIGVFFVTKPFISDDHIKSPKWSWLIYAIPCLLVFSVYLYAFWPGLFTADTEVQWGEITNFKFSNKHPFFHTLTIWLITRIWGSLAAVSVVQVIGFSLLVGWGGKNLRCFGVTGRAVWVACVFVALSPFNGFLSVTPWKDIFYGISFFALILMLIKIALSQGYVLKGQIFPVVLGIIAALVALYRHNGPPAAFGTLLLLLIVYRHWWRKLSLSLAIAVTLWLGVMGPLISIYSVEKEKGRLVGEIILAKIAAHINAGVELTEEENELLFEIPYFIDTSRGPLYTCGSILPVQRFIKERTGKNLRDFPLVEDTKTLFRIFISLSIRNPMVTIKSYFCTTSWMWRIFGSYKHRNYWGPIALEDRAEQQRFQGIKSTDNSLQPRFRYTFFQLKKILYENDILRCLFLNATLYLYLFIFSLVICAIRRKDWKVFIIFSPIFFHTITLFFLVSHTGFRYQWPVFLSASFLFLPLLFVPRSNHSLGN